MVESDMSVYWEAPCLRDLLEAASCTSGVIYLPWEGKAAINHYKDVMKEIYRLQPGSVR